MNLIELGLRADINGKGRHDGQRHAKGGADERRAGQERDAGARSKAPPRRALQQKTIFPEGWYAAHGKSRLNP